MFCHTENYITCSAALGLWGYLRCLFDTKWYYMVNILTKYNSSSKCLHKNVEDKIETGFYSTWC